MSCQSSENPRHGQGEKKPPGWMTVMRGVFNELFHKGKSISSASPPRTSSRTTRTRGRPCTTRGGVEQRLELALLVHVAVPLKHPRLSRDAVFFPDPTDSSDDAFASVAASSVFAVAFFFFLVSARLKSRDEHVLRGEPVPRRRPRFPARAPRRRTAPRRPRATPAWSPRRAREGAATRC